MSPPDKIKMKRIDNTMQIKVKNCLECNIQFKNWHSKSLLCKKCYQKTTQYKLAKKIYNAKFYGTPKYLQAVRKSRAKRRLAKLEAKNG